MGLILYLIKESMTLLIPQLQHLVILAVLITLGFFIYIGLLWLMDRSFVLQTKANICRALFN
jgi:hypothetical protein